jgi:hypothetical protein
MEILSNWVTCDGCGLPASPAHIAERVNRLELATRYRPIHISALFVAASPLLRPEDDFYGPPESRQFFDPFLEAVDIFPSGNMPPAGDAARLAEFQRRGYYLSYLSECPLTEEHASTDATITRSGPMLARRIRFNYKPRQTVILGNELSALRDILEKAGLPNSSMTILEIPTSGDAAGAAQFRAAFSSHAFRGSDSA